MRVDCGNSVCRGKTQPATHVSDHESPWIGRRAVRILTGVDSRTVIELELDKPVSVERASQHERSQCRLHPQVEGLLGEMAAQGAPPIHELSVTEARSNGRRTDRRWRATRSKSDAFATSRSRSTDAEIGARVYTPEGDGPHPVVLFFHGGGWVICSLDTHDNICPGDLRDAAAVVVSVDYRMAPEFRVPHSGSRLFRRDQWVADNAQSLGGDASRLAVCGDSAGGNLSAVVSQMARTPVGHGMAFAALIYPAVDMTAEGGSLVENARATSSRPKAWNGSWATTCRQEHGPTRWRHRCCTSDLSGLPPCFIATCEFDPLRDEGEAYAAALKSADDAGSALTLCDAPSGRGGSWNAQGTHSASRRP